MRDAQLVEGERGGPGREAAEAAEVVEPSQHSEQRVVGRLLGDVVEVPAKVRVHGPSPRRLESRGPQEKGMEIGDGPVTHGAVAPQAGQPVARDRVRKRNDSRVPVGHDGVVALSLHALNE